MQIPRWRHILVLKNSIAPSSPSSSVSTQLAHFHSTPTSYEKWKNKWSHDIKKTQQPSKNHVRYETRHKRADAKKALNDLLYRSGSSRFPFQNEDPLWKLDVPDSWNEEHEDHDSSNKKDKTKCSTRRARKADYKRRMRRKLREECLSEDEVDHPETVYQATFGNRTYTWSFKSWQDPSFSCFTRGFEWKEEKFTSNRRKEWDTTSESESDYETSFVGSSVDRTLLGLPPRGPLKIEDVKNAFRLSAKKWHPDMHQGPSQAMAEEKFKLCVNAYKSLCSALS